MLELFIVEPQPHTIALLKGKKDVSVVGSASSTAEAMNKRFACDLVLVSAILTPAEVLKFVRSHQTDACVITDVDETDNTVVAFLEAGAVGYVPSGVRPVEMVSVLHAISLGKPPLAPRIGTALVERMHELLALQKKRAGETLIQNCPDLTTLTGREREILMLIRRGASNQEIAAQLMIELGTVKNHVHNILKKLNVSRRAQAASFVDLLEQTN